MFYKFNERIRNKVLEVCPNASEAFLEKNRCISKNKKKVGIEHATKEDIYNALSNYLKKTNVIGNLTSSDLYELNLMGKDDSKDNRDKLARKLNLGVPNAKTLLKRLNHLGITKEEIKRLLDNE